MGHEYSPIMIPGILKAPVRRKHTGRTAYVPVVTNREGGVAPVNYHGSAHLNALSEAEGLLKIPAGVSEMPEGQSVYVRQI